MKIRNGFVSNSSSSSFVCDVCGRQESGWDACLKDFEMSECVNGHVICNDELLEDVEIIQVPEKCCNADYDKNSKAIPCNEQESCEGCEEFECEDEGYGVSEACCPICQWKVVSENDFSAYLLKEYKIPRDVVFADVKKKFPRRKKLYNSEYVNYVCLNKDLNRDVILVELSKKFKSYAEYLTFIKE